ALLRAVDIRPNEAVLVLDIENAARFETYVLAGEEGSGIIGINGAAAKLVEPGHRVIIVCFAHLEPDELDAHEAKVVVCDQKNRMVERFTCPSTLDEVESRA